VIDTFEFAAQHTPKFNPISISGYHIREAGSTAIQELAFTLRDGIEYVEWGIRRGLAVDDFAPSLSFFFNAHNDFLEEIAKFRAARRLWARLMRDRFGATNPRAQQMRFHAQTAGSTLTAQQPDNNIVRVALQALAAVLGGTQSLHCNGRDEALALPTEESAQIALRTQQIIAAESGVTNTVDPVAGAYAIEGLTDGIERDAEALLARIDRAGGTLTAIETGLIQREIQESAYRAQLAVESNQAVVVGVNAFVEKGSGADPLFHIDPEIEPRQIERLRAVRASRSVEPWRAALEAVSRAARDGGNLVPPIIAAVESRATVGEISDAMRSVFGEYKETTTI